MLGSVASSRLASVRGAALTPGSTVFNDDTVEVGPRGSASIALAGGGQVQLAENSLVRLIKMEGKVAVAVGRGRASFRSNEQSPVEALVADATIRALGGSAVGIVYVRSPESAIIGAEKGALLISTEHDARTLTLREGEGIEVTLAPAKDRDQGTKPAGRSAPAASWTTGKVVLFAVILAGAVTAIALLLGRNETEQSTQTKCNEISPFRCI